MLVLAAIAAICDLRNGKIPNRLILAGLAFGLCWSYLNGGAEGLLRGVAGFGVGFVLLLPGYLLRFTGAGDLKLLATLGLLSGPGTILVIFVSSVVVGALFILLSIVWRVLARWFVFFRPDLPLPSSQPIPVRSEHARPRREPVVKQRLPMAPFYALGCTLFFLIQLLQAGD
jgi:prepilin peptidase CpaA